MMKRRGFTLVEILVVITILGVLMVVLVTSFGGARKKAEKAKCQELVSQVATVFMAIYDTGVGDREGMWPEPLLENSNSERGIDTKVGLYLAKHGMGLSVSDDGGRLIGKDQCGVLSPWAEKVMQGRKNDGAVKDDTFVPSGGTIESHRLRYALCGERGKVQGANVGGEKVDIDVKVAVWCCGADGKIEPYSKGRRGDDVYSWDYGKVRTGK